MPRKLPKQKPGKSEQRVETPADFLEAVERRWGKMDVDLACDAGNMKAPKGFYFPEVDSLKEDWLLWCKNGNGWLNPEFGNIAPFAAKCFATQPHLQRGRIFMLTPASVCSDWYLDLVKPRATTYLLRGRIIFVGSAHGFPKDLILSVFEAGAEGGVYEWNWRAWVSHETQMRCNAERRALRLAHEEAKR
jgi:hypothetical protein